MKKVVVIAALLFGLIAAPAEAAHKVHLKAKPVVQTWHSRNHFSPTASLEIGVYVSGFLLKEHPNGECELEWIGKGIAVRAYLCGRDRERLTVQYVSFDGPRRFQVQYALRGY